MILKIEIRDLRKILKEKCEEIISDEQLADVLYRKMCEIEDDERFIEIKEGE